MSVDSMQRLRGERLLQDPSARRRVAQEQMRMGAALGLVLGTAASAAAWMATGGVLGAAGGAIIVRRKRGDERLSTAVDRRSAGTNSTKGWRDGDIVEGNVRARRRWGCVMEDSMRSLAHRGVCTRAPLGRTATSTRMRAPDTACLGTARTIN